MALSREQAVMIAARVADGIATEEEIFALRDLALSKLPAGWKITRADKPPFKIIVVDAPDGSKAVISDLARNPENVFYKLANDLIKP